MNPNEPHEPPHPVGREAYEPPRVIEDLSLETFSLACAKADLCGDPGEPGTTS
jgi:hypothetical protein